MRSYPNAARGLRLIFWSQVLPIIGAILSWTVILYFIGAILILVGYVMYLVGLNKAKVDDPGYATAFTLAIVELVLTIVGMFLPGVVILTSVISPILDLVILYLVCMTTARLAASVGRDDIARTGRTVWMINIVCTVIGVVLTLLTLVMPLAMLGVAVVISAITSIASLVGAILYIVFLYKASVALA